MTGNCPLCAVAVAPDDRFCGECGAEILSDQPLVQTIERDEQTDRTYAEILFDGFKRYFLHQEDLAIIGQTRTLFVQAIEIDGERPEAYIGLGMCYFSLGDDKTALTNIEQGLKNGFGIDEGYESIIFEQVPDGGSPDEPLVYELDLGTVIFHRAVMHLNLDDVDLAAQDIEGVFDIIPDEYVGEKHAVRAEISLKRNDLDGAWRHVEVALSVDPECTYAYTIRGRLLLERGEAQAAAETLSQALSLDSAAPEALLNRAKAFHATGDTTKMKIDIMALRSLVDEGYADPELGSQLDYLERLLS